jgi:periplasmic protein CpxP/Spy
MKNKYKILILLTCVLLVVNAVLLYLYLNKGQRREHGGPGGMMKQALVKEVGFDDGQAARFELLRTAHQEKRQPLFDSMRTAREALFNRIGQTGDTDSSLQPLFQHIARQQQLLDRQMFNNIREIRGICRPEQLPAFDSLAKKMMLRMGGRRMMPGMRKEERK